jgi:hypothetical protein
VDPCDHRVFVVGICGEMLKADHLLLTLEADTLVADKAFDAAARVLEPPAAAGKTAVIRREPTEPRRATMIESSMRRAI